MKIEPQDFHILDEQAAFDSLVDMFAEDMKEKFAVKLSQGCTGWLDESNPELEQDLRQAIHNHVDKQGYQMVDIGNFAVMIWNLQFNT